MKKHATIPVFVPHLACPNQCVFCNQVKISGAKESPEDIMPFLENAIKDLGGRFEEVDIAFFGGTFTAIEESRMISYLEQASHFLKNAPEVTGIRLSTRPDAISEHILDILESYGVTAIELGCQSFDDGVLAASRRGHTAKDTFDAVSMIKRRNFELVLQLMPGMYGDTDETVEKTLDTALSLAPDGVRLYPCVVISETPLADLYQKGLFTPLSVEKAVEICAKYVPLFEEKKIKVIKTGLHSSDLSQNGGVIAGPYHPAFGELVRQRIYLEELRAATKDKGNVIYVAAGETSKAIGNKKENLNRLFEETGRRFKVKEDPTLRSGEIKIAEEEI